MPDITRQRTGQLLRGLFEILMPLADGMQARDALAALAEKIKPTPFENGVYPSGGRRYEKIVRFATVDCVKAGWFEKVKGRWSVTDVGKSAYETWSDPEEFYRQAVKLYNEWKASQPDSVQVGDGKPDEQSVEKAANITLEEAEEQAWNEIEHYLLGMKPYDFQDLVAALLKGMGYHVAWVAPPGKDGGIDIFAWNDPLGTRPPRIKVQVKRQKDAVNVEGLRSFLAVLGEDDVGLFVSTGGFTKDASSEARTQDKRKVTLIDLEKLFDLWVEYYHRLDDGARQRLPLKPIHFLAP